MNFDLWKGTDLRLDLGFQPGKKTKARRIWFQNPIFAILRDGIELIPNQTTYNLTLWLLWFLDNIIGHLDCVAKLYAVLPVSTVKYFNILKCLYFGGREEPLTNISIFNFYDIKNMWFEFGNYIFTGFKMPTL